MLYRLPPLLTSNPDFSRYLTPFYVAIGDISDRFLRSSKVIFTLEGHELENFICPNADLVCNVFDGDILLIPIGEIPHFSISTLGQCTASMYILKFSITSAFSGLIRVYIRIMN